MIIVYIRYIEKNSHPDDKTLGSVGTRETNKLLRTKTMQSLIMIGQFLNALQANEQVDFNAMTGSYYMVDSSSADLYVGLGDEGYTYTVEASDGEDVMDAPLTSVSQLKILISKYCKLD